MSQMLHLELADGPYRALARTARQEGKATEALATELLTAASQRLTDDPLEPFLGALTSSVPDWADRHDEYLGKGLLGEHRAAPDPKA